MKIRRSHERGQADHGWLQSQHTFSFASYYDPEHVGVSSLIVINDDQVAPSKGFATHSHEDMEILSYVRQGTIEHKDSMGNIKKLPAGEFQLMSAGTGVTHSEYNPSNSETLKFLQIWIQPNVFGIEPEYQQKRFPQPEGLQLILSPDGQNDSLHIHQYAYLYHVNLSEGKTTDYQLDDARSGYLHLISGTLEINGKTLEAGDGVDFSDETKLELKAQETVEALLFDLP